MRYHFLLGSLLFNLIPLCTPIKINPKIANVKLSSSLYSATSSNDKILNKSNRNPPTAFINFGGKPEPKPEPVSIASIPFAQQLILLPIVLKFTALVLVPFTKKFCELLSLAVDKAEASCLKLCKMSIKVIIASARELPSNGMKAIKAFNCMCLKTLNSLNNMCTSVSKNTLEALIEFYDNAGKGCVDMASGAKSWTKKSCSFTYKQVLLPFAINTVDLITQVTQDVTAWVEDATLFTCRYASMIARESAHFVTNLSIDVADWLKHYSVLTSQIIIAYVTGVVRTAKQTFLDIPVWFAAVSVTIIEMVNSLFKNIKDGLVEAYDQFWLLLDKIVDAAPFLVRYEEDGQSKIALSPRAQMALYIISTIHATQPLWENPISDSANANVSEVIKSFVSNLQTRFFPPRTLFFAGALARGLQQSSSLKKSFNPTVGVGAMINFGAATLEERWINYIVSGWFISGNMWTLFGSKSPEVSGVIEEVKSKKFW